jgi:hypothetical protein
MYDNQSRLTQQASTPAFDVVSLVCSVVLFLFVLHTPRSVARMLLTISGKVSSMRRRFGFLVEADAEGSHGARG